VDQLGNDKPFGFWQLVLLAVTEIKNEEEAILSSVVCS